jgi:hypothetical protein
MGEKSYRILVRKPEGRRLLERSWRRWEGSIRMDQKETDCKYGD